MTSLSTTYLIPAILLNPAFILHLINTFVSHIMPPPHTISHSPHRFMESLGPLPGSTPYLDMHADEQLCWRYTAIMVVVQVLAFGRVQDNRVAKKSAKAAKLERERIRKEKREEERLHALKTNGHVAPLATPEILAKPLLANGDGNVQSNGIPKTYGVPKANGVPKTNGVLVMDDSKLETESEDSASVTETSEEEMIV